MSTAAAAPAPAVTTIDESVLLRCIQMLEDCDPTGDTPDPPELAKVIFFLFHRFSIYTRFFVLNTMFTTVSLINQMNVVYGFFLG